MARIDHPIHRTLVEHLDLDAEMRLLDLGCGEGGTLRAARDSVLDLAVVGLDADALAIAVAKRILGDHEVDLRVADLSTPLPLPDGSVDRVVSHNVLECLAEPGALLEEAARVLTPGGLAVWSHVDSDALMIGSTDVDLGRRVLHAYADQAQNWMDHADGRLGRKLAGMIRRSSLDLFGITVHSTIAAGLEGDALQRVDEITTSLLGSDEHDLSDDELHAWRAEMDGLSASGDFFLSEPTVIVVAERREPPGPAGR